MKKAEELTFEHQAALYSLACRLAGIPTFEPKSVKVDSLGGALLKQLSMLIKTWKIK